MSSPAVEKAVPCSSITLNPGQEASSHSRSPCRVADPDQIRPRLAYGQLQRTGVEDYFPLAVGDRQHRRGAG